MDIKDKRHFSVEVKVVVTIQNIYHSDNMETLTEEINQELLKDKEKFIAQVYPIRAELASVELIEEIIL